MEYVEVLPEWTVWGSNNAKNGKRNFVSCRIILWYELPKYWKVLGINNYEELY